MSTWLLTIWGHGVHMIVDFTGTRCPHDCWLQGRCIRIVSNYAAHDGKFWRQFAGKIMWNKMLECAFNSNIEHFKIRGYLRLKCCDHTVVEKMLKFGCEHLHRNKKCLWTVLSCSLWTQLAGFEDKNRGRKYIKICQFFYNLPSMHFVNFYL